MQIHAIAKSLREITNDTPVLAKLLPGEIAFGERTKREALAPYGLLDVSLAESEGISAGVKLVTYDVVLTVVVAEEIKEAGTILATFHHYWDRITFLPALNVDVAKFVLIHPGPSGITEAPDKQLGKDVIQATTSWTLRLSESYPETI